MASSKSKALGKYKKEHAKIAAMVKDRITRHGKSSPKSFANGKHWTTDDIPR